jgi:hypothetical protein
MQAPDHQERLNYNPVPFTLVDEFFQAFKISLGEDKAQRQQVYNALTSAQQDAFNNLAAQYVHLRAQNQQVVDARRFVLAYLGLAPSCTNLVPVELTLYELIDVETLGIEALNFRKKSEPTDQNMSAKWQQLAKAVGDKGIEVIRFGNPLGNKYFFGLLGDDNPINEIGYVAGGRPRDNGPTVEEDKYVEAIDTPHPESPTRDDDVISDEEENNGDNEIRPLEKKPRFNSKLIAGSLVVSIPASVCITYVVSALYDFRNSSSSLNSVNKFFSSRMWHASSVSEGFKTPEVIYGIAILIAIMAYVAFNLCGKCKDHDFESNEADFLGSDAFTSP